MFVSPLIVILKIALLPSTVAATTFESDPDWPTISASILVADEVWPISKSISFELPIKLITALALPQELLAPVLSQFKSTSFELPCRLICPV